MVFFSNTSKIAFLVISQLLALFLLFIKVIHLFHLATFSIFSVCSFPVSLWCALAQYSLCLYYLFPIASGICGFIFLMKFGMFSWSLECSQSSIQILLLPYSIWVSFRNQKYTMLVWFMMSKISLICSYLYFMALVWKWSSDQLSSWLILSSGVSNMLWTHPFISQLHLLYFYILKFLFFYSFWFPIKNSILSLIPWAHW